MKSKNEPKERRFSSQLHTPFLDGHAFQGKSTASECWRTIFIESNKKVKMASQIYKPSSYLNL